MSEDEELLTDWEKATSKKLEKLDSMEREIAEIKKLVTKPEPAPAKVKPPKSAKKTIKELIAKSIPFLGVLNVDRFIELAQKEGLVGDKNFSDQDIALISDAIGEPLLILDEAEREEAISLLCEKLGISKERFETIAKKQEEQIWLSVDEEYWRDEEEAPAQPSEIEVIEKTVPEEE